MTASLPGTTDCLSVLPMKRCFLCYTAFLRQIFKVSNSAALIETESYSPTRLLRRRLPTQTLSSLVLWRNNSVTATTISYEKQPTTVVIGCGFSSCELLRSSRTLWAPRKNSRPSAIQRPVTNRLLKDAATVIARLPQATVAISKWLPHNNCRLPRSLWSLAMTSVETFSTTS